ncbi:pyruvate dehydrogenase protein-like protein x component [Bisporella sp. PMI_857]|nr:pyruvate dehydrogenase protein-like protein x component [Bisporella sp. PMI_857]
MASLVSACRLSARLTVRQLRQDTATRGFRTSSASLAAQNFSMPALSPTMTEGNIASWKVKEGDSFIAGDVLLEIETDKASMDVEAQDDGVLAKIIQGDGSKGIKVGTRIGVIAETGDDLSSLEIPPEESAPSPPKEEKKAEPEKESKPEPKKASESPSSPSTEQPAKKKSSGSSKKTAYPATPAVASLLSANGLDASALEKITATGPQGRVLKGDVLAYLKSISSESPAAVATSFDKRSTLPEFVIQGEYIPPAKKPTAASPQPKQVIEDLEVAVPISLKAVVEVQKRIESALGVFMPLSTFIARATDVANDGLPRPKSYQPSADELFNQVLGLDNVSSVKGFRGTFLPQVSALPTPSLSSKPAAKSAKKLDIIDLLSGKGGFPSQVARARPTPGLSSTVNVFSVKVPKGDEKTAKIFLERVKTVLEVEPGRLVL